MPILKEIKNWNVFWMGMLTILLIGLFFVAKGKINAEDTIHEAYISSGLTTTSTRGCYTSTVVAIDTQCESTLNLDTFESTSTNYSVCGDINDASPGAHKCTSGKLLDSAGNEVDWSPGKIINCNTCVLTTPSCNTAIDTGNFTTNCRYSNCTRTSGTKTCDKNSGAPSTCGASQSWTTDASGSPIICPTACDSSTQTSAYQYHCTTDGRKTKVYTSTAGNCRPSADEIENCTACTDGSGGSTNQYTSCPSWPAVCSAAQIAAGQATIQCGVPSTAQCAPTQQGQSAFTLGATRPKTKNCCTLNDYTQSCSQGSTTEVNAPAVPSYTYSAALKSGIDCVALPSTSLATSCCVADVKSCTAWQCVRDGDGGKNRRDCTPYACKADKSGFNSAGAKITEDGTSCSSASCSSGDYESAESVVVPCTANSTPTTQGTEKFGKKKKTGITCNGASWIDERSVACCTQNSWTCGYSPDCGDSNGGQTITQTCTINTCTYSSSVTTPDNSKPEPSKSSKYCPDRNASQVGGSLPDGADGNTLRYYSGGWSSNSFLKNIGSAIGIGVGAANPNGLLEISNASNTTVTARARITDITHNPELQLQYGIDVIGFAANQHWGLYVANSGEGAANDKSFHIWGLGGDRFIIDKDGYVHAEKFCKNMDTNGCTELTGGGGGTANLPAAGTAGNLLRSEGGNWTSWTPNYISNPTNGTSGQYLQLTDSGVVAWATVIDRVGALSPGSIPKWEGFALKDSLLVEKDGKIGIGTTGPNNNLTVVGSSRALENEVGVFRLSTGTGLSSDESLVFGIHDSDYSWIQAVKSGTATRNLVLNGNGGNVGIGSTGPTQTLQVTAAVGSPATTGTTQSGIVRIGNSVSGSSLITNVLDIGRYAGSPYGMWMQSGDASDLSSTSVPLILNPKGGNVGIGTPKPSMLLTIAGTGQNPTDSTSCPAGTEWISENGDTTRDNGECKSTIALNPDTGALRITKNAGAGKVLVSDVNGNGTWKVFSSLPDGTAQGQTLWWDNTDNVKKWIVDNKLTIDKSGSVGIGAVTPAEFETSRFAVKGDDPAKKNGMFVSLQGSDTVISTTPPPSAWAIIISFAGSTNALKLDGKKLTITYYVQNTGTKPLDNASVIDTKCTSNDNGGPRQVIKSSTDSHNIGDSDGDNVFDSAVYAGNGSAASTPGETWVFRCVIDDVTTKMANNVVIGAATVTADKKGEGGIGTTSHTTYWKAEKRIMGRSGPTPASAVAQPAAQPESTSSGIVPATPAGAGNLAPAAPAGPAPAWGGAQ